MSREGLSCIKDEWIHKCLYFITTDAVLKMKILFEIRYVSL